MGAVKRAAVVVLLGVLPMPPAIVNADVIRGLRAPNGAAPCEGGLDAALQWIGDRSLPFDDAVAEAQKNPAVAPHVQWGLEAIGSGYGSGYGYGYGSGDGYGSGYGSGYGYGYGSGDGFGSGYGSGYGYCYGYGYGSGSGSA